MEKIVVSGITYNKKESKITIKGVPDRPGIAAFVFNKLAEGDVNVDMIIQNVSEKGATDISFTIFRKDSLKAVKVLDAIVKKVMAKGFFIGVGMRTHTGIASAMFKALADKKINIEMISTSEIKISVVVREDQVEDAVRVLHNAFKLGKKKPVVE